VSGLRVLPARWVRVWRYTVGSVVAAATSALVFAGCYDLGLPTLPANVLAFAAGAVPNWVLNRRWAWQRTGRVRVRREVLTYAVVSMLSLLASTLATGWADAEAPRLTASHTLQVTFVAGAYVLTYGVLFVAKYLVYEFVVFPGEPAWRSRHQVPTTTRPNRTP
jgi:putative flippase GtrA